MNILINVLEEFSSAIPTGYVVDFTLARDKVNS